jgi:glycosyltransferase involved in cell wall biosynthesis
MKPVVWMIARNEEFYISMALLSVVDHANVYVLDTGSTDGMSGIVEQLSKKHDIYFEKKSYGTPGRRFPSDFNEMEVRNYALRRAKEVFSGVECLIQLDADEIVNDRFWVELEKARSSGEDTFGYATNILTSPYRISTDESFMQTWSGKYILFDPHVRVWSTKIQILWYPRVSGEFTHCIPKIEGHNENLYHGFVSLDNIHFHLHRSFGPKSIWHYLIGHEQLKGIDASLKLGVDYDDMFYSQRVFEDKFPAYFDSGGKFVPPKDLNIKWAKKSKGVSFPIPDFVIERWKSWGYWI